MSNAGQQVHSKFKLFTGQLAADLSLTAIAAEVESFARDKKVASKSIGVEYLEHSRSLVMTLGYRDDEAPYPIKLHTVRLGTAEKLDAPELARLEKSMGEAAAKLSNVICHELFVTEKREFLMVLMTTA